MLSRQRMEDVLSGVDQLAAQAALGGLTSRRLSKASGIAEGVMFRLFSGMDDVLKQWIDSRGARFMTLVSGAPANRDGFIGMLQALLDAPELLGLLFDDISSKPAVLVHLQGARRHAEVALGQRLTYLAPPAQRPVAQIFVDHLWVSLRRNWDPQQTDRRQGRQRLLGFMPWEMTTMKISDLLPDPTLVQRLAVNDSGFVFDPVSGRSFTVNSSGLTLLRLMMHEQDVPTMVAELDDEWDVDPVQAERDLIEFAGELRKAFQG